MKICRDINYSDFGITEENGWKVSYDWNKLKKIFNKIDIAFPILIISISPFLGDMFFQDIKLLEGVITTVIALVIFIFILTPIHEILHIIPMAGFKLDDRCYIILGKGTIGAFYNGEITNKQNCISLITPFIVLGLIITLFTVFSSGIVKSGAAIVLLCHVGGCYRDIYMFFYMMKKFPSDTIFFGNRYRVK